MDDKIVIINNEKGSTIVLALIMLVILTIIGVSSVTTSTIELQIVRNERIAQINFYQAEAGAHEAAQRIEQEVNALMLMPGETTHQWINDTALDFTDSTSWLDDGSNSDQSLIDPTTTTYTAIQHGVKKGSSLDMGSTRLYQFAAFGRSTLNRGDAIIDIGYLKRY